MAPFYGASALDSEAAASVISTRGGPFCLLAHSSSLTSGRNGTTLTSRASGLNRAANKWVRNGVVNGAPNGEAGGSALSRPLMFTLRPPTVHCPSGCQDVNDAVAEAWARGGGAAWLPGAPAVNYSPAEGGCFSLATADGGPLSDAALSAALDSIESAALDACVSRHLVEGGDDRLHLANGVNRYFCAPVSPPMDTILRGACTCSPPTPAGWHAARGLLRDLWTGCTTFEEATVAVRKRLPAALGLEPHMLPAAEHDIQVVLHPSGSDAELVPLAIAEARAAEVGCSRVINIIAAAGEVGSGTAPAAGGRHFSAFPPIGDRVPLDGVAAGFSPTTTVVELAPRSSNGRVLTDYDQRVVAAVVTAEAEAAAAGEAAPFFVLHAVDGSKTGLRVPSVSAIDALRTRLGPRVLLVLDACQCRSDAAELAWYLGRGAVVLVTASKFFAAPGFCGAVLVPPSAAGPLSTVPTEAIPRGFRDYLTCSEVPHAMPALRGALPAGPNNIGLLLRWECGLTEMELYAKQRSCLDAPIRAWVRRVKALVRTREPRLSLLDECDDCAVAAGTTGATRVGGVNTIVSIKFLSGCGEGLLTAADLRKLHRYLTCDASTALPPTASAEERAAVVPVCMVGQPVKLGPYGVLRLAMSAPLARKVATPAGLAEALEQDAVVLDKMVILGRYCDVLA